MSESTKSGHAECIYLTYPEKEDAFRRWRCLPGPDGAAAIGVNEIGMFFETLVKSVAILQKVWYNEYDSNSE